MSTTTTVRSIEDTVRQAMNNSGAAGYYEQYARPVVAALVEREKELSEQLVEKALSTTGYDDDEARHFLGEIGMAVDSVDSVETDPDEDEEMEEADDETVEHHIKATLDRIQQRLDGLTDFARRNGYRG